MKFFSKPPAYINPFYVGDSSKEIDLAEHVKGEPFKYHHGWVKIEGAGSTKVVAVSKPGKKLSDGEYLQAKLGDVHGAKISLEIHKGKTLHRVTHESGFELHQHPNNGTWNLFNKYLPLDKSALVGSYKSRTLAANAMHKAIESKKSKEANDKPTPSPKYDHFLLGNSHYVVKQEDASTFSAYTSDSAGNPVKFISGYHTNPKQAKADALNYHTIVGIAAKPKESKFDWGPAITKAEELTKLPQINKVSYEDAAKVAIPAHLNNDRMSAPTKSTDEIDKIFEQYGFNLYAPNLKKAPAILSKMNINRTVVEMASKDTTPEMQKWWADLVDGHGGESSAKEILSEEMRKLVDTWAGSSSDHDPLSLSLQAEAHKMFGVGDGAFIEEQRNAGSLRPSDGGVNPIIQRAFLRATYQSTQAELKARGVPERITLRRGMTFALDSDTPLWVRDIYDSTNTKADPTTTGKIESLNPLTSWTPDLDTALYFGGGIRGVVITAEIPRSSIISSAMTGLGCLSETEFVVAGIDGIATVTPSKYADEVSQTTGV